MLFVFCLACQLVCSWKRVLDSIECHFAGVPFVRLVLLHECWVLMALYICCLCNGACGLPFLKAGGNGNSVRS